MSSKIDAQDEWCRWANVKVGDLPVIAAEGRQKMRAAIAAIEAESPEVQAELASELKEMKAMLALSESVWPRQ